MWRSLEMSRVAARSRRDAYRQREPALLNFLLLSIPECPGEDIVELCDRRTGEGVWVAEGEELFDDGGEMGDHGVCCLSDRGASRLSRSLRDLSEREKRAGNLRRTSLGCRGA